MASFEIKNTPSIRISGFRGLLAMVACQELLLAQGVAIYKDLALSAGFHDVPLQMIGVTDGHVRQMAGNSFSQACSNAMLTFALAHMQRVRRDM